MQENVMAPQFRAIILRNFTQKPEKKLLKPPNIQEKSNGTSVLTNDT
jgi:hypothetical protein